LYSKHAPTFAHSYMFYDQSFLQHEWLDPSSVSISVTHRRAKEGVTFISFSFDNSVTRNDVIWQCLLCGCYRPWKLCRHLLQDCDSKLLKPNGR
jgi:hypothetical protein